jgi:hypothetical protein
MDHLRSRLIEGAGGRDFSGIAGCELPIWFGESLADLPPRRSDESIIEPLLDAMAEARVDRNAVARLTNEIAERGFPSVMPPVIEQGATPDGSAGFIANVNFGAQSGQLYSTGLGFDVQLSRPTPTTATDVLDLLQGIVTSHDKPVIQHLIVTAGGPDRRGLRYPGEEIQAAFMAQQPGFSVRAHYLRTVRLHLWSARRRHPRCCAGPAGGHQRTRHRD